MQFKSGVIHKKVHNPYKRIGPNILKDLPYHFGH